MLQNAVLRWDQFQHHTSFAGTVLVLRKEERESEGKEMEQKPPLHTSPSPLPRVSSVHLGSGGINALTPKWPGAEKGGSGTPKSQKIVKTQNFRNFLKFCEISGFLWNSRISKEIQDFRKTGCPFAGMLKTTVIHILFYRFWRSFPPKTHFSSKKRKSP